MQIFLSHVFMLTYNWVVLGQSQHSITSKNTHIKQTKKTDKIKKSLENNKLFYYLQKSSKVAERYNYIKLKQTSYKFSLFISPPKFSYSLAASSNLSSVTFSSKPINFLKNKTKQNPCLLVSSFGLLFPSKNNCAV